MSDLDRIRYTWTLDSFSNLVNQCKVNEGRSSPLFPESQNQCQWQIVIYPSGETEQISDIVLVLKAIFNEINREDVKASVYFKIRDSDDETICSRFDEHIYTENEALRGCRSAMNRDFLLSKITDNVVKIRVVIYVKKIILTTPTNILEYDFSLSATDQLGRGLYSLFKNKILTDFTLIVKGEEIPVHRIVLIARSPLFSAISDQDNLEVSGFAVIEGLDKTTVFLILKYMYTGKCENPTIKNVEKLLIAADKFAMADLKHRCENVLSENLKVSNALHTLILADSHNAENLKADAEEYIATNIKKFLNVNTYKNLEFHSPLLFIELLARIAKLQLQNKGIE